MSKFFQSARLADKLILFFASFFILFLSTFATCRKDLDAPPGFPAATQTGANTMGAIVNGKQLIVYQLPGSLLQSLDAWYINGAFSLYGFDPSKSYEGSISISLYNVWGTGKYIVANQLENNTLTNNWAEVEISTGRYLTDSVNTGTVTITRFDIVNHIISGTFSMMPKQATVTGPDSIVSVQSGRFDVTYIPPN